MGDCSAIVAAFARGATFAAVAASQEWSVVDLNTSADLRRRRGLRDLRGWSFAAGTVGHAGGGARDGAPNRRAVALAPAGIGPRRLELVPDAAVRVDLLDVSGRRMRRLLDRDLTEGARVTVPLDLRRFAPGVYFLSVESGDRHETRRVVLVR